LLVVVLYRIAPALAAVQASPPFPTNNVPAISIFPRGVVVAIPTFQETSTLILSILLVPIKTYELEDVFINPNAFQVEVSRPMYAVVAPSDPLEKDSFPPSVEDQMTA
jgi:hypothetical protein